MSIALAVGLVVLIVAAGGWWYQRLHGRPPSAANRDIVRAAAPAASKLDKPARAERVRLVADEQVVLPSRSTDVKAADARPDEPRSATAQDAVGDPTATRASSDARTGNRAIEEARQALEHGKVLEARQQLNALLKTEVGEAENTEVRALLTRIADDTIFSRRSVPNDPLIEGYTIQAGDVLLNIGRHYGVPHEALMQINGIPDATKVRPGQKLKVPRGPFNVQIYKSEFRLDVYLQDVYVRSYRVGLGTENGTPEGVWKVKNRLENPTYYPPASAADKRIIPPDDPTNPLGRRWIGLEGVAGDAVGHEGYGIHGTIEPESIGKAVSLGCIRMHNEDVAFLYMLMMPGQSTVTILP
jgi:hypothetical protein